MVQLKIILGIIILISLISGCIISNELKVNTKGGADYTRIQDAINNARDGSTILVYSGTYYESVNVDKKMILRGVDNGGGKPIIDAKKDGNAVTLSAGSSTLEGFVVVNSSIAGAGIRVHNNNNTISNNVISNNYDGIYLYYSGNNTITKNILSKNEFNFRLDGETDSDFYNHIDMSNLVDGKPIYYKTNVKDTIYDSSSNAGNFYCIGCINVTITDLNLNKNGNGIFFYNTANSKIQNVNASNNMQGIFLLGSDSNILSNNTANFNKNEGIRHENSNNTILNGNVISENGRGIFLFNSNNNTLSNNTAYWNTDSNFWLSYSGNNTLSNNTALHGYYGIILGFSNNNIISDNIANSCVMNGIEISYNSKNNIVSGNTLESDKDCGILIDLPESSGNILNNNTVSESK